MTGDEMASPMYVRPKLRKCSTKLQQEDEKNQKLAQGRYKMDYDRRVRFYLMFLVGEFDFLNWPHVFRSDAKRSTPKR